VNAITDEEIAALGAKYGGDNLTVVEAGEYLFVTRKPSKFDLAKFAAGRKVKFTRGQAATNLVQDLIVWPDRARVSEILSEKPFLLEAIGGAVLTPGA
jgi:hypothetical protein